MGPSECVGGLRVVVPRRCGLLVAPFAWLVRRGGYLRLGHGSVRCQRRLGKILSRFTQVATDLAPIGEAMLSDPSRAGNGMTLTARLCLALSAGAVFVAALLGLLGADRAAQAQREAAEVSERRFAEQLAERAAPMLERGDLLRLSMLATAGRDLHAARVILLERTGRVVLDTDLVLGDRQLNLLAQTGSFQRVLGDGDTAVRETLVPVRFGGEVLGELRLHTEPYAQAMAFDLGLFGLVLLGGLTLVAVSGLLCHHWASRVRGVTDAMVQLASGHRTGQLPRESGRELFELGQALQELEKGVQDGLHRVVEEFVEMALQVVDGLERRNLVPPGHGTRTARYAMMLADRLDLIPADRRDVELACRLSDIGRAWIRPGLLLQAEFDAADTEVVRQHPVLGAEHLDCLPGLRRIAEVVRHQGERHDGCGLPLGLRNERIPLGSRMLAIASAFDLLTTCGDPSPLSVEDALLQMAEDRGEVYDPWMFDLFAERMRSEPAAEVEDMEPADRSVMILPPGSLPSRVPDPADREGGLDYALGAELEIMLDELPPEERA